VNDALRAPKPIDEVTIIGLGQLGRVFAGGLLRAGCGVVPVNRGDDMAAAVRAHPAPEHEAFARQVANEAIDIQDALTGTRHDRDALIAGIIEAFDGDPAHGCTGRSAPARLARAIQHADAFGLAVPTLRALAAE
jgi:hypothetical protein